MPFSRNAMGDSHAAIALADYRARLHAWLDAHHAELAPRYPPPGTLDDHIAQMQRVKSILFDAGWMQFGWPERVGGRGGSPMLRTELGAALAARPRVLALPRRAPRRRSHGLDLGDPRSEGLDQPGPVFGTLRAARAHGPADAR